jgi:hypothetical protein
MAWFVLALVGILTVVSTAGADTVTKAQRKNRICFTVTATPAGRPPAAGNKAIFDFHLIVPAGMQIISVSSPDGWNGHLQGNQATWTTTTRPIRMGNGRGGFCVQITGAGRATWITTDKDGAPIVQGHINLP